MNEHRLCPKERQPDRPRSVTLSHVCKNFGAVNVLDDVHISFEHGRVHALMGASGSGKTTLMRLLAGLEKPDAGHIEGMNGLKRSAVFQEDRLCENLSVAVNIRMPHTGLKGQDKQRVLQRCENLLRAMGMDETLTRPVHELSGGMKRRVALARAVLADADVLFFDEPLKGLDEKTEQRVMTAIVPLLAGKTVFWATHREEELRYFSSPSLTRIEDIGK